MWWWWCAAWAGPLGTSREEPVDHAAIAAEQREWTLEAVLAHSLAAPAVPLPLTVETQSMLTLRFLALSARRDCAAFQEMRKLLPRASFVVDAVPGAREAGLQRLNAAAGGQAPEAWRLQYRELAPMWDGPSAYVTRIVPAAAACPGDELLAFRDELVFAGLGELSPKGERLAAPGEPRPSWTGSSCSGRRRRRSGQTPTWPWCGRCSTPWRRDARGRGPGGPRPAGRRRAGGDACSAAGRPCSEAIAAALAVRDRDAERLDLDREAAASLVDQILPASLDRLAEAPEPTNPALRTLGWVPFGAWALGCVPGGPEWLAAPGAVDEAVTAVRDRIAADGVVAMLGGCAELGGELRRSPSPNLSTKLRWAFQGATAGCGPVPWAP
ncbi:MAG: hypothetical protein R3F59_24390 [Myxococcota bacterium]